MPEVQVGQVWEQVSKHERGMQLEVVRGTGRILDDEEKYWSVLTT